MERYQKAETPYQIIAHVLRYIGSIEYVIDVMYGRKKYPRSPKLRIDMLRADLKSINLLETLESVIKHQKLIVLKSEQLIDNETIVTLLNATDFLYYVLPILEAIENYQHPDVSREDKVLICALLNGLLDIRQDIESLANYNVIDCLINQIAQKINSQGV